MALVLIGYRGTGKSTIARLLALRLGWDWVDADVEVELRAGRSIAAIFAEQGEAAFRDLESQVLRELLARQHTVIAAGGGAVLKSENRQALQAAQCVVWLRAAPETILRRLAADPTTASRRPSLTGAGGLDEIETLLAQRTPLYEQCACVILDTDELTPQAAADEILSRCPQIQPARP
jgi:shikimate kinase